MHTIILLLYIPYIAGGRSENLGGNLVISNSKRFFDGIGFASNSAKTGGGICPRVPPGSNGLSLCWHSSKREAFLHDGQPTMDSVRWLYKGASKFSFDG